MTSYFYLIDKYLIDNYQYILTGITAANGAWTFLKRRANLDAIVLLATTTLAADSIITPWFTGDESFHNILGFSPNKGLEQSVRFYEYLAITLGNLIMFARNTYPMQKK